MRSTRFSGSEGESGKYRTQGPSGTRAPWKEWNQGRTRQEVTSYPPEGTWDQTGSDIIMPPPHPMDRQTCVTRMHSSRMRTAHPLTISHSICWGGMHGTHAPPPPTPCTLPTTHASWYACPPAMHAPCHTRPPLPHMPPFCLRALIISNKTCKMSYPASGPQYLKLCVNFLGKMFRI